MRGTKMRASEGRREFGLHDAPVVWRVIEGSDLAHVLCPPVPPMQPKASDRPASIRQTFALLEIDRIKRQTPPAPMVRGSTEIPQSASGQIEKGPSDIVAGIELLCSAVEFRPAALQQNTGQSGAVEFPGERDAGGPRADDADFSGDVGAVRDAPQIDEHAH